MSNHSTNPMNAQQVGEQLASLLVRYLNMRGIDPENWQAEVERMLTDLGFKCIDGVWRSPKELS